MLILKIQDLLDECSSSSQAHWTGGGKAILSHLTTRGLTAFLLNRVPGHWRAMAMNENCTAFPMHCDTLVMTVALILSPLWHAKAQLINPTLEKDLIRRTEEKCNGNDVQQTNAYCLLRSQ